MRVVIRIHLHYAHIYVCFTSICLCIGDMAYKSLPCEEWMREVDRLERRLESLSQSWQVLIEGPTEI